MQPSLGIRSTICLTTDSEFDCIGDEGPIGIQRNLLNQLWCPQSCKVLSFSKRNPILFSDEKDACPGQALLAIRGMIRIPACPIARADSVLPSIRCKIDNSDIYEIELPHIGKVAVLRRTEFGLHKKKGGKKIQKKREKTT